MMEELLVHSQQITSSNKKTGGKNPTFSNNRSTYVTEDEQQ